MVNNSPISTKQTVCEWLFFNANSAIYHLCYDENRLCTRPARWIGFFGMYIFLSTRTHYPDFEPTSLWSYPLMPRT